MTVGKVLVDTEYEGHPVRMISHPEGKHEFGILARDLAIVLGYFRKNGKIMTDRMQTLVSPEFVEDLEVGISSGKKVRKVIWKPGISEVFDKTKKKEANRFLLFYSSFIIPAIEESKAIEKFNNNSLCLEVNGVGETEIVSEPSPDSDLEKVKTLVNSTFNGEEVRFVEDSEGKYMFGIVANDLAKVLGYFKTDGKPNTNKVLELIDEDYYESQLWSTSRGDQDLKVIWEPGFWQVLATSRKSKAKPFQKHLYEVVLPQIRQGIIKPRQQVPTNLSDSLRAAAKAFIEAAEANEARELAEQKHKELEAKYSKAEEELVTYRSITPPDATFDMKQVADGLAIKGLGRNNLIAYLRKLHFICQDSAAPYNAHVQNGLARIQNVTKYWGNNEYTIPKTLMTFEGLKWLIKHLIKDGYPVNQDVGQLYENLAPKKTIVELNKTK